MDDDTVHYLHGDTTSCGQRRREDMLSAQEWDFVNCLRCWFYQAEEIFTRMRKPKADW